MILASIFENAGIILLFVVIAAALLCLIAFFLRKMIKKNSKNVEETQKTEDEIVQEELDKLLVPVEDEKTKKEIEEYKESDD